MKSTLYILLIIFFSCVTLSSQTVEIEKAAIKEMVKNEKKPLKSIYDLSKKWDETMTDFGVYPEFEFEDENYIYKFEIGDVRLATGEIFNIIKEWIAINYDRVDSVLRYESEEHGTLIFKIWSPNITEFINQKYWARYPNKVDYVSIGYVVSCKVEKQKVIFEFRNIEFRYKTQNKGGSDYFMPGEISISYLEEIWPVILKKRKTWISRLKTMKATKENISETRASLVDYLKRV